MHTVEYEGEIESESEAPLCIAGERACPPDDLEGRASGYDNFLKVIMDESNPDRERTLYYAYYPIVNWDFDPEIFEHTIIRFRKAGMKGTKLEYW